jgi:hypothetical protein
MDIAEDVKAVSAFGILDPDGKLLPATGNEEGAVFAMLAFLLGFDEEGLTERLTSRGYRVIPVTIASAIRSGETGR